MKGEFLYTGDFFFFFYTIAMDEGKKISGKKTSNEYISVLQNPVTLLQLSQEIMPLFTALESFYYKNISFKKK